MGEEIKQIITALMRSENAMSLGEFVEATGLPVEQVAQGLDFLVATRIFQADNSMHNSEMGEIVYMFADNDNAQELFRQFSS